MERNHRNEMLYQKSDFNKHLICQLPNIFKCCKCKKNNTICIKEPQIAQHCLFCGTPNYVRKKC